MLAEVAAAVPPAPSSPPPAAACREQRLSLHAPPASWQECVSGTRVSQSGDVRSYLVSAEDADGWTLRVARGGGMILEATLSSPSRGVFRCASDHGRRCAGILVSERDALGARVLSLRGVRFQARTAAGAEDAKADSLFVDGTLSIPADESDPVLACAGATVQVVHADRRRFAFCPAGGAGVALSDDGTRRIYTLRDLEGESLLIGLDGAGRVDGVTYGDIGCAGSACGGVATQRERPDPQTGESTRSFRFDGTALWRAGEGAPAATLQGTAQAPDP